MAKLIHLVFTECHKCAWCHLEWDSYGDSFWSCENDDATRSVTPATGIPDWCPLDDAQEEKP